MRKTIGSLHDVHPAGEGHHRGWFDLEQIAAVEVTSEDPSFPVESAFAAKGLGWRASHGGEQRIRVIFDEPQSIRRIQLRFHEADAERTQEFLLGWLPVTGGPLREVVRQQWNFSPAGSTTETEDYAVELENVSVLELKIQPDLSRGDAVAKVASWRIG